jgi:hypothetical protein
MDLKRVISGEPAWLNLLLLDRYEQRALARRNRALRLLQLDSVGLLGKPFSLLVQRANYNKAITSSIWQNEANPGA